MMQMLDSAIHLCRADFSSQSPIVRATCDTRLPVHELSVAQSLIELIETQVRAEERVVAARVRIGALSGVVPEALRSAFGPAAEGTCATGARFDIEWVPVTVWCEACAAEVQPHEMSRLCCPACGQRTPRVVRGRELELVSLEVVDAASNRGSAPEDPQEQ
jgi:hydrogenase nickel incorporation protein HypA/HybF